MKQKTCKECGAVKSRIDFYGGQGECKECTKTRVRSYRMANIEKIRAYDRVRGYLPRRKEKVKVNYHKRVSTPDGRAKEWARAKEWRDKNKVKRAAHVLCGNAIRDGKLQKKPCERCGSTQCIHAHHEDYCKPMDVIWLCRTCHGERHREINEGERRDLP